MISHAFFAFVYAQYINLQSISKLFTVGVILLYGIIIVIVFSRLKRSLPECLFYPMLFYLITNATMNVFALLQLQSNPCIATRIIFLGAILFFISDSTLFFVRFKKSKILNNHFLVMLTYIGAEFMNIQGLTMLS